MRPERGHTHTSLMSASPGSMLVKPSPLSASHTCNIAAAANGQEGERCDAFPAQCGCSPCCCPPATPAGLGEQNAEETQPSGHQLASTACTCCALDAGTCPAVAQRLAQPPTLMMWRSEEMTCCPARPLMEEWNLMSTILESYMWSLTTMGRCGEWGAGNQAMNQAAGQGSSGLWCPPFWSRAVFHHCGPLQAGAAVQPGGGQH